MEVLFNEQKYLVAVEKGNHNFEQMNSVPPSWPLRTRTWTRRATTPMGNNYATAIAKLLKGDITCSVRDTVRVYSGLNSKMAANRDVIEYPLAMLWRHWRAFPKKINGIRDVYLNSSNFETKLIRLSVDIHTILSLKLLMFNNNSVRATVLSL